MAMKTLAINYLVHDLSFRFGMSDYVIQQAKNLLLRCWDIKMNKFKLAIVCASLSFKFHEAEETSGRWIRPGLLNKFKDLAETELVILRYLDYKLTY